LRFEPVQVTGFFAGTCFVKIQIQAFPMSPTYLFRRSLPAFLLCLFSLFNSNLLSQPILQFTEVSNLDLAAPVDFVHAGDGTGRVFLVERSGTIKVFDSNFGLLNNFLTVDGIACCGEQGLLSMAFHPDYETNRYFFVYYTNSEGGIEVARYRTFENDPNTADPDSRQTILTVPKPVPFTNHNGGDLNFGPDGMLYFAIGDGGSGGDPRNYAQRSDSLLGKMVRIDVDDFNSPPYYTVPADNPYANSPDTLPEIWAFGLRNPWRWSFDRATGDMWIADVGQGNWEEVNFRPAGNTGGVNYGWRCYEGDHPYGTGCQVAGTYVPPIFNYSHSDTGGISITGGFVYRGTKYPNLVGYYVCADYNSGNGWLIHQNEDEFDSTRVDNFPTQIVSFGETEDGELYMVLLNGTVYEVGTSGSLPVTLLSFNAKQEDGATDLTWTTEEEENLSHYEVQYSTNGVDFQTAGKVTATGASSYAYAHEHTLSSTLYYRLKIVDTDNSFKYSTIIKVEPLQVLIKGFVQPNIIQNNVLRINLKRSFDEIAIINLNGKLLWKQSIKGRSGIIQFPLHIAKGTYVVRFSGKDGLMSERLVVR
jgi:glucose/arabinose dehydrogenase